MQRISPVYPWSWLAFPVCFPSDPKNISNCRYWPQIDVLKETKDEFKVESGDVAIYSLIAHFFIIQSKAAIRSIYGGDYEEKLTSWLKTWLRECLREAEKLKPLIEKEKLTKSELDKIQERYFSSLPSEFSLAATNIRVFKNILT